MKIRAIILASCFATAFGTDLSSQPLDSLLSMAARNNPDLAALDLQYQASLQRVPQVGQLPDPEVGVGGFPLPVETRLGAQVLRVGATQMLPWFGVIEARKEMELARAGVLHERIGTRELDVTYAIRNAYFELYQLEQSAYILRRRIPLLESLERLALAKVESGSGSTADVLQVQMRIEELRRQLDLLKARQTRPRVTINQLLNRAPETVIVLPDTLAFAALPDRMDVFAEIRDHHPMLRMYEREQEVARQAMELNTLDGKPSFGVGVDYIFVSERTDAFPDHNGRDIAQVRATVRLPIGRQKYAAKNREEQLRIEALDKQREGVYDQFLAAVESAFATHEMAAIDTRLFQRQIELTQSVIVILEAGYSARGTRFDELLRLEEDLITYEVKLLEAVVQSHKAKAQIQKFVVE